MTEFREDDSCGGDLLSRLTQEQQLSVLRMVVDKALEAIIVHEPDGRVVFYSEGACRLLGMTAEEMLALCPFGWVAPEAIRGAPNRLESILHEGRLVFPSSVRRKDGVVVPTIVSAFRVESPLGPLVVATIRDLSESDHADAHLQYLAFHDTLTGLASRAAFNDRLRLAIADAKRYGDLFVLAYIDLDRFKPINDRYGHSAGDDVLVTIAERLQSSVREQDLVARLGGDEFVVLFGRVQSTAEIPEFADRLLAHIREPLMVGGEECRLEASIGFSVFDSDEDDARTLVTKADTAMYEAKSDPVHPWLLYDPGMGDIGAGP